MKADPLLSADGQEVNFDLPRWHTRQAVNGFLPHSTKAAHIYGRKECEGSKLAENVVSVIVVKLV